MKGRYTFHRSERLRQRNLILQLFREGKSIAVYPFLAIRLKTNLETESPVQVLFAVSKKSMKRAISRNRVKRRMREAYRLEKESLLTFVANRDEHWALAFVYQGEKPPDFALVQEKIKVLLTRLMEDDEKTPR